MQGHGSTCDCTFSGNAMHAVRTQCKVLDVGKYSNPSFGPFSQVFGSVPGCFFGFSSIWDVAYLNCQPFPPRRGPSTKCA